MKTDPIVEEIKKFRQEHAKKFNYDFKAIFDDLKKREKNCGHTVVSFPPILFLNKTETS
jgi:hypothetical protein